MTVRRINFTGRKDISHQHAKVALTQAGGRPPEFEAHLLLEGYGLPADAMVSVEAYRQTSWMRFACGTVGQPTPPTSRLLHEFDSADGVLFRVRVTSSADPEGLLLAEADRIRPREPGVTDEKQLPLLPAKADDNLGEQVYRVDFSDRPILLINSRVGDWRAAAREPAFISLVFPAALREILSRILYIEGHHDLEDPDDWRSCWLRFATMLTPSMPEIPAKDHRDQFDDWVDEAVAAFCRWFGIYGRFNSYLMGAST